LILVAAERAVVIDRVEATDLLAVLLEDLDVLTDDAVCVERIDLDERADLAVFVERADLAVFVERADLAVFVDLPDFVELMERSRDVLVVEEP
jgi:hypothetical protein